MNPLYSSEDDEYVDDYEEHIGKSVKCKKYINNAAVAKKAAGLKQPATTQPVIKKSQVTMKRTVSPKVNVPTATTAPNATTATATTAVNVPMEVDDWEDLLN
jgi:hypothetical protein